jgi:hypothetical protein
MTHSVDIRAVEADFLQFMDEVLDRDGVLLAGNYPTRNTRPITPTAFVETHTKEAWLARSEDVDLVRWYKQPERGAWFVERYGSPAIQLFLPLDESNRVTGGWLQHETGFFEEGGLWRPLSPAFISWADGIMRWVKRHFKRNSSTRTCDGPNARALLIGAGEASAFD